MWFVVSDGMVCGNCDGFKSNVCGCGLDFCWCRYGNISWVIVGMGADVDRCIFQFIKENWLYIDLFTENCMWVNGFMVFYMCY